MRQYPNLDDDDDLINYYPRSANAWIEPKKDNYFDNNAILRQFKRLFILIKFKRQLKDCGIEILVDNATTHSAKVYDINQFNKFPDTCCPHNKLEWTENGESKR